MTLAIIAALCLMLLIKEFIYQHERKQWFAERRELYSRIQAGTLQEYIQTTREPTQAVQKDREQRVSEAAEEKGIMRQDMQYPQHWKG